VIDADSLVGTTKSVSDGIGDGKNQSQSISNHNMEKLAIHVVRKKAYVDEYTRVRHFVCIISQNDFMFNHFRDEIDWPISHKEYI
jgi:hypothetical protein